MSGPIVDRLDLHVSLPPVRLHELRERALGESSEAIRERVQRARARQRDRRERGDVQALCNAHLGPRDLEACVRLEAEEARDAERFATRHGLSARGYGKVLRVARTIADLAGAKDVAMKHVLEAITYRVFDRRGGPEATSGDATAPF